MAQVTDQKKITMGGPFWRFTIGTTVTNIAVGIWLLYVPLDSILTPNASDRGHDIEGLFRFMAIVGFAICSYVMGYLVYFGVMFRRRPDEPADSIGVQIHDQTALEVWWTVIPAILLLILTIFSIQVWYKIQYGSGVPAITAEVIGRQFGYTFRYPELKDPITNGEMHLPVGKSVRLYLSSQDVLHSFWVPQLRLKADTVPGLVQNLNFTATREGTYPIVCTEFCGVGHGLMGTGATARLVVESPAKYDAWLSAQKTAETGPPVVVALSSGVAADGKALFTQKCVACHSLGTYDQRVFGPGLGHIFTDKSHPNLVTGKPVSPENVAGILHTGYNGPGGLIMPSQSVNGISDKDIANLTAFLVSLK